MTIPLISESQWSQIRRKAALPQFAPAVHRLRHDVQDFLARPVQVPERPGGYYHDYFCPQHGIQLSFEPSAPHVHRCPVGGETHAGEPFDSAWRWFANDRLAQSALRMAVLWQLEHAAELADRVRQILLAYAAHYTGYTQVPAQTSNPGIATYTTLDESVWAIPLAWAFDLIRETVPPAESGTIVDKLLIPVAEHLVAHHFRGIHNFACWHNAAIGTLGVVTGRADLISFAIDGPYGFRVQVQDGILADGLWFEGSFSYHFYTVAALFSLAKATANQPGWDLRQEAALASVLRAPVLCAYPDGTLPATNDCWYFTGLIDECCHGVPKAPAYYEIGHAWFGDTHFGQVLARAYRHGPRESLDALLYGRAALPTEQPPPLPSTHLAASGYAILRSQPAGKVEETGAGDQQYILLKYGPHGGGHGHPDKLGLTLYAHGTRLSPDLGTPGYGIELFESWYRQTLSHNSVLLNGMSQPPATGTLNRFRGHGPFQIADASVVWGDGEPDAYRHVTMRRLILACPHYFLDLFSVVAPDLRQVDWVYRNAGALASNSETRPYTPAAMDRDGYSHISAAQCMETAEPVDLLWTRGDVGIQLFLANMPGSNLICGHVPGNPPDDRQGIVISRRQTPMTAFLALFFPFRGAPQAPSVVWHGRDLLGSGWAACSVALADQHELWILRLHREVAIPAWVAELPSGLRFEYELNG